MRDGGQRLWGAFMLQGDNISLYYSGDTGYSSHFREIPDLFGAPDYALLGIGAYKPRWFMQANHISPYDPCGCFADESPDNASYAIMGHSIYPTNP